MVVLLNGAEDSLNIFEHPITIYMVKVAIFAFLTIFVFLFIKSKQRYI